MPYGTKVNKNLYKKLAVFIIISVFSVFLLVAGLLNTIMKSTASNNMLYIEVLNYTLPVVKEIAFDASDMAESEMNIKEVFLTYFKLEAMNPIRILARENAFFSLAREYINEDKEMELALNPFSLKDIAIFFKQEEQEPEDSKVDIYNPDIKKTLNESVPEVLIYHTHTTEYFQPATASTPFDENNSVVAVGKEISRELRDNYGISVIHDRTIHNTLYNNSYTRSGETLDKYMAKYNSFKVIIDLHRDGGPTKSSVTCTVNGEEAAKLMFVLSKSSPNYQGNLQVADSLKGIIDREFPGVMREHRQYNRGKANFNQNKSPQAALIEVGSEVTEIEEAILSAKIIARAIAEYINGSN